MIAILITAMVLIFTWVGVVTWAHWYCYPKSTSMLRHQLLQVSASKGDVFFPEFSHAESLLTTDLQGRMSSDAYQELVRRISDAIERPDITHFDPHLDVESHNPLRVMAIRVLRPRTLSGGVLMDVKLMGTGTNDWPFWLGQRKHFSTRHPTYTTLFPTPEVHRG